MRLATLDDGRGGEPAALLASGEFLCLRRAATDHGLEAWLPTTLRGILAAGPEGLAVVRQLVQRVEAGSALQQRLREQGALVAAPRLLAPVPSPSLIVAAGLAYKSHLAEMAGTPAPAQPTGFMKSPHSVLGSGCIVAVPPEAAEHVDYEGELAVVFGRTCHGVRAEEALRYVAGYTVANDISARDWVRQVWQAKAPWEARQTWETNIMGKQFEGFTPLGPVLLTADEVPDPAALRITTRLNGTVMQDALVGDLIFELGRTIAHFARWYTFRPGDVLLTGTPAGVGVGRKPPVFMHRGDLVEVEISGIGTLGNRIG